MLDYGNVITIKKKYILAKGFDHYIVFV